MSKKLEEKVVEKETTDSIEKKDSSISFFSRIKKQVKTFNLKNNESTTSFADNLSHLDESALEKELREKEKEVRLQEKELKKRALELENAKKKFEEQQRKIEEERKKNELARAERERLEKERIAREKELERQRIEKEKAEKREKERLEKERIAREKELERQRIEKERAEQREKERLEKERITREKELERQRIEKERAEQREKERLEKERIAREKELERQRIEKEQAERRKREYRRKEKEFQILEDKKKIEFLQKENEMREHKNTLLSLETTLISLEDKIEEKKLTISTLKNRKADKEKIILEEKRLNSLVSQKQITQKDISSEKKIIEKIQKNLEIEYKLDGIKKEVINEEETAFKVKYIDNNVRNIFVVSLIYIKTFILKNIFRCKIEHYDKIKKIAKNIKVRIATSLILAIILSLCFLVTLKFISSAKEHYVSFGETNTTAVDTTEEMKKQKEAEEKAKILEAQEKAEAARIDPDAQDEEITAKLAGTFSSYSFDVDRQVTINKKIHAFKSASWSDQGEVIDSGTKLTVNKIVSPAGYLMYQISSGTLQGQFITANEKFVSVDSKTDQLETFISRPVAIKFLATQNVYSDEGASKVRVTFGNGAQLNINGIGINNNRLIYHVSDGSFVPVNPIRVIEVNRETPKTKNIDNDNKNTSNSQSNQKTTS